MDGSFRFFENLGAKLSLDSEDDLVQREPRARDVHRSCGFNGCTKFAGHGGFHEKNASYDLPTSPSERDSIDAQDVRDDRAVTHILSDDARRARAVVRRYRQGQRFFRLHNRKGPRVEILSIEVQHDSAVVDGARGVFVVALCDLLPDTR